MTKDHSLQAVIVPVTSFAQNCSVVWCTETNKGAVIDPGGDLERILQVIETHGPSIEKILVTHGHFDHAGGAAELAERFGVPIEGPGEDDAFLIGDIAKRGATSASPAPRHFHPNAGLRTMTW